MHYAISIQPIAPISTLIAFRYTNVQFQSRIIVNDKNVTGGVNGGNISITLSLKSFLK